MQTCKRILCLLLLLIAGSACATSARPVGSTESASMRSYVWYDGDSPRRVWLDPQVVAVFEDPDGSASQSVRSIAPQAQQLPSRTPGLRLWRLPQNGSSTVRSLQALEPDARVSPVLRDSPSARGSMRALPGGVIVYLDPDLSGEQASAWLQQQNLQLQRQLFAGQNVFLVETAAGLPALELANQLRQQPGVVAAMPDWWQELEPR